MGGIVLWIILLIIFVIIEALTVGLVTIFMAGGSLVAMLLSYLGCSDTIQWIGFGITSLLLILFVRPIATKYMAKQKTNIDALIDTQCIVIEDIDNLNASGKVKLNGIEWSAKSLDGRNIEKGKVVIVKKIEGVKVIVIENI